MYVSSFNIEELQELSRAVVKDTLQYFQDTVEHIRITFVAYMLLCVLFYILAVRLKMCSNYGQLKGIKRVLFVIAHPDDECMFFGPVVVKLTQKSDCQLYMLCLSEGDYGGNGKTRRSELWESCKILGIPDSHITLCKNEYLPDDPKSFWREDIVANLVLHHIESLAVDTVVTFDKQGVSKHRNHSSIFYAMAYLLMEKKLPLTCRAFVLESINLPRKYSALFDVPVSYLMSSYWYVISPQERKTVKAAMAAHSSQYVWFRRLYMIFSRYTFINTFKELEPVDLELDLELDD